MDCPNFLVIMSDQHNRHLMAHAGETNIRTPNLDRLAASGVSFPCNYCAGPLCVPSRMAFLASRYPSDLRVWTNTDILDARIPTFAHQLALAGWETTLCGRMHFEGPDQHHGFERRLVGDVSGAALGLPDNLFEGVWAKAGCGQSCAGLRDDAVGPGQTTYMAFDADVTARACELLQEYGRLGGNRKPYCLVVGLLLPHNPYVCPKELFEEYMDKLPAPEGVGQHPAGEHPAVLNLRRFRGADRITPAQARRARAAYFGLITLMDRNIGRILDALAEQKLAENTVILYTSDHGDLAGEHGLWWKDSFYEGSVGAPMIWSWPRRFRTNCRVDAVVSSLDTGPTLAELAGAEPLPGARGRSLFPLLETGAATDGWPATAFAETYAIGQRPARMIRSGRWKLNVYHGYEDPQLFDMVCDPGEENDLGRDPACAEVRRELTARVMEDWSGGEIERYAHQTAGQPARHQAARMQFRESERWLMRKGINIRAS